MARITLRVQPGARKRRIVGRVGPEWKIAVVEPPVDGRANRAAAAFLAELTKVPKSGVELVRGASARRKTFEVAGLSAGEIEERIAQRAPRE